MKRSGFKPKVFERPPRVQIVLRVLGTSDQMHASAKRLAEVSARRPAPLAALLRPPVTITKGVKAKPGGGAPTVLEARWMGDIVSYGCVACRIDARGLAPLGGPPAVHHILRGGRRMGHRFTLPLCDPGHHQGGVARGMVSRHPWKTRFERIYGTEDFLLRKLCKELGWEYPG